MKVLLLAGGLGTRLSEEYFANYFLLTIDVLTGKMEVPNNLNVKTSRYIYHVKHDLN